MGTGGTVTATTGQTGPFFTRRIGPGDPRQAVPNIGRGGTFTSTTVETDLFFSRRIGLSDTGQVIPIIGGARLAGKTGRHNIGILDIQTDRAFNRPGDNFLVARYGADVLKRSRVGAIFINKETLGGEAHYNRTMGADANLVLGRNLQVNS